MKFFPKSLQFNLLQYLQYLLITFFALELYTFFAMGYFKKYLLSDNSVVEFLTIILLYSIFFIMIKAKKLLFIPIGFLLSYFTIDIVANAYNRYLDFSDLINIPLLFEALLQSKGQVVYLFLVIPMFLIYFLFKSATFKKYMLAFFIIIILFIIPSPWQNLIGQNCIEEYTHMAYVKKEFWSPKLNIDYAKTGRLSTFFYAGMKKQTMRNKITDYLGNRNKTLVQTVQQLGPHLSKRNVYLIGLESFSLPEELTKLELAYKNNDGNSTYDVLENASVMITSIFGGGTIQSEFEALCGVPALQKLSAFELTEFTGSTTNCLPTVLNALNYETIVTNTHKPGISFKALKALGFYDINYPKEYFPYRKSYLNNKNLAEGEYAIFDTDLFNQNQEYIKTAYISQNKHIFNYIFSVWGHAFHDMTSKQRKKVITIENKNSLSISEHTVNAINQEYYRIKALQNYFNEIKLTDPSALVIAFSDHRPVLDGADSYKKYGLKTDVFHNYIIIMDKGKYIKYDKPFPLYALPDIILDRLTDGWYCTHNTCKIDSLNKEQHLKEYYEIMANAMNTYAKEDNFIVLPNKIYFFNDPTLPFIKFSQAEENYRWNDGKSSEIRFQTQNIDKLSNIIELHIGTFGKQNILISLNNHLLYKKELDGSDFNISLKYNKNWLSNTKVNTLHFDLPNAKKPNSSDSRTLAMKFISIQFSKNEL